MGRDPRTTAIFIILVAAAVGYMVYDGAGISLLGMSGLKAGQAHNVVMQDSIGILEAQIDSAKRELARGTVEDLRRRIEGHRASLAMLRRLVPVRSEVPNLLDDISTRAKIRGVTLSEVVPQATELGPTPFDTDKYNIAVLGRYDEIGEFLSDIASLQRIIVPIDVNLTVAGMSEARALGDTSGSLLQARFQIKTYVKTDESGGEDGAK
ncbi:MAG: type 4a pilus biogenesis protein PilO [Gemmatimonadales bacterium]